ncbi:MAG: hypothetical protein KDD82_13210 [Planctomycetes bacterium]|nr:hypothetical protein [Planctomycetota bacterium]
MTDSDSSKRRMLDEGADRAPVETTRLGIGCLWAAPLSLILWSLILWGALAVYRGLQPH